MLTKLTTSLITGLKNVLTVIVLFVLVVGVIKWAQANPDDWQALVDRLVGVLIAVINWVLNQISTLVA